ncbi:MAG TPA: hypothetical protein VGX49_01265, partial [Jatrophihabitans sp.]|nr:hypothetical protein [Jatrophihabitans sp.]
EARLTDWGRLARSATGPQPAPELSASPPRQPGSFGWQLTAGVLAVALAAVIAVGLPGLLAKDPPPGGSPDATSPASPGVTGTASPGVTSTASPDPNSTASAGPGMQVVTFHGLSITVPASWQVAVGHRCGTHGNAVELPASVSQSCFPGNPVEFTRVRFVEGSLPLSPTEMDNASHTTVGGLAATRVQNYLAHPGSGYSSRAGIAFIVAELQASVHIMPAEGQTGQDVADSLTVNSVDAHGCRSRATDVNELPHAATSDRAGQAEALLPGQPVSVNICRYQDGWLEQGRILSGTTLQAFAAKLNAVPRGLSRPVEVEPLKCRGADGVGSVEGPVAGDSEAYRLEAHYPDGTPVVLVGRISACGDLGISNGARTGQRTPQLVMLLLNTIGASHGWPDKVIPVP